MSTSYWAIEGLGLEADRSLFDYQKLLFFIKANFDLPNEDFEDVDEESFEDFLYSTNIYYEDLLEAIVEDFNNNHIGYINGGNADTGNFILFFTNYPWQFKEQDLKITEEEARELVYECIRPYLKDELSKEDIMERIYHISTYGCG